MSSMSVQQLAAEVKRQQDYIRDFICCPGDGFQMSDDGQDLRLGSIANFKIGRYAHGDLGSFTGIDKGYYDKMLAEDGELLATNVNRWLPKLADKPRMIRTLEGRTRAVRSNKFRALDNAALMEAVLPALYEHPGIKIQSCNITEQKLYLKAVLPKLEFEVKKEDIVQFGVVIANSEIGQGSLEASIFCLRLICLNGMTMEDGKFKRSHLGGRLGDDVAAEYFADETRQAADKAFFLKLRDTVGHLLTEASCEEAVQRMRQAADMRIGKRPDVAVKELGKRFSLVESEQDRVLDFLIRGGDMSQWGLVNALTATAGQAEDYDRESELEKLGGKLLELNAAEWTRLAA